jgi:hypothetical protein
MVQKRSILAEKGSNGFVLSLQPSAGSGLCAFRLSGDFHLADSLQARLTSIATGYLHNTQPHP